jgi:hypothetical protein
VTLTTVTSEVLGSNTGRDSGSANCDISWFYRVSLLIFDFKNFGADDYLEIYLEQRKEDKHGKF